MHEMVAVGCLHEPFLFSRLSPPRCRLSRSIWNAGSLSHLPHQREMKKGPFRASFLSFEAKRKVLNTHVPLHHIAAWRIVQKNTEIPIDVHSLD